MEDELRKAALARRDELRLELTRIDRVLSILGEGDEPSVTSPKKQTRKRRAKKVEPSGQMMEKVKDYINSTEGPVRTRQVVEALGVSTGSAGKTLKALADAGEIEFMGNLTELVREGKINLPPEKGRIALYQRKNTNHEPAAEATVPAEVAAEGEAVFLGEVPA